MDQLGEGGPLPLGTVDVAIQQLYLVSLALASCVRAFENEAVSRRLAEAIDGVDEVIRGLRAAVFEQASLASAGRRATKQSAADALRSSLEHVLELAKDGARVEDAELLGILDAAVCAQQGLDALNRTRGVGGRHEAG